MQAFLNMRASSSHADADFRPKNWREKLMRLYPNGSVSLTALTALMPSESTNDPQYYWFDKGLPKQAAAITAGEIYTDAALSTAYVSGGAVGATLYVKCVEDDLTGASEFRAGHQVLLQCSTDLTVGVNAKVLSVNKTSTFTVLAVKLLEADDNSTTNDLSNADRVLTIGNINPEGSQMPDSISYDPTKHHGFTQIFRTSLSLTRTRMRTQVRYGTTTYQEAKRDCLELHGLELEKAFIWSILTEGTGTNGQPERTTAGLMSLIPAANKSDFRTDADFHGYTWIQSGEEWIDKWLEVLFRYGARSRTAYVGSGTLLAINKLIKNKGQFVFTPQTTKYGIKVTSWDTVFGSIDLYMHPLFSFEPSYRYSMMLFDPSFIRYRYIDDTFFQKDDSLKTGTWVALDGIKEGYLTECGLEYYHTDTLMLLNGFGYDHTA